MPITDKPLRVSRMSKVPVDKLLATFNEIEQSKKDGTYVVKRPAVSSANGTSWPATASLSCCSSSSSMRVSAAASSSIFATSLMRWISASLLAMRATSWKLHICPMCRVCGARLSSGLLVMRRAGSNVLLPDVREPVR